MLTRSVCSFMRLSIGCALFGLFVVPVLAGELYRCENTAGSVSYQQTPCSDSSRQQVRRFAETDLAPDAAAAAATTSSLPVNVSDAGSDVTAQGMISAAPQQSNTPPLRIDPQPQGRHAAWRCTRTDGSFYFSIQACGSTSVYGDEVVTREIWSPNDPRAIRGGVFIGPNTVMNPITGETTPFEGQVFTSSYRPQHLVPDQGVVVNRRAACKEARYQADVQRRENADLGFSGRRALDDQVWDMCNSTRKIHTR